MLLGGTISRAEFVAWWPKWQRKEAAALFGQIDDDKSGSVSSTEFADWWTKREGLLEEMWAGGDAPGGRTSGGEERGRRLRAGRRGPAEH